MTDTLAEHADDDLHVGRLLVPLDSLDSTHAIRGLETLSERTPLVSLEHDLCSLASFEQLAVDSGVVQCINQRRQVRADQTRQLKVCVLALEGCVLDCLPNLLGVLAGSFGDGPLDGVLVRVAATGALERSRELALDYASRARACLDGAGRREELEALTRAVVERSF